MSKMIPVCEASAETNIVLTVFVQHCLWWHYSSGYNATAAISESTNKSGSAHVGTVTERAQETEECGPVQHSLFITWLAYCMKGPRVNCFILYSECGSS